LVNFYNILLEGRYDSLTRRIVNDIFYVIKQTEGNKNLIESQLPRDTSAIESYKHESGIEFTITIYVTRIDRLFYGTENVDYHVNTYIADDDELVLEIAIDTDKEPQVYEQLIYKINEDIRHEIEHYTQEVMADKPGSTEPTAQMTSTYEHHKAPTEIPAMVHGFYRRARVEKRPLDDIMWEDLNKDIKLGHLTQEEAEDLFRIWINYSRRRLPKAIYSTK
jgi:hypothetical protein